MYEGEQSDAKKSAILVFISLVLLVVIIYIPKIILGSPVVSLDQAKPYAGLISQYLNIPDYSKKLPVEGIDFRLDDPAKFSGGDWLLIPFTGSAKGLEGGYVIMKKVGSNYVIALGPSTVFSANSTIALPDDLSVYLSNKGLIYGSN